MKQRELPEALAIRVKINEMKQIFILIVLSAAFFSCRPTKKIIGSVIDPKDTTENINPKTSQALELAKIAKQKIAERTIDFRTFSAKIKIDSEDENGKNPDITAVVRMVKDSAIWVSLTATLVNFEVYRALITKDKVILLDKTKKTYTERSLDYLQEVTKIPFDFQTLQNLIVGNPVFYDSANATAKKIEDYILVNSVAKDFKNLLTLHANNYELSQSKLDDIMLERNRSANISYREYEKVNGIDFSTYREMNIAEKNKLDIRMKYKQYEFNKDLSVSFVIPKNYKKK